MHTVLQSLKPSGTPSNFPTKKSGGVPTLPFLECKAIKIPAFLAVVQVITLLAVHQLLQLCIPVLSKLSDQLHFLQMLQVQNHR